MSAAAFADELNRRLSGKVFNRAIVANYENGRTEPPEEVLKIAAQLFKKPFNWFYEGVAGVEPLPPAIEDAPVRLLPEEEGRRVFGTCHPLGASAVLPVWRGILAGDGEECYFVESELAEWEEMPAFLLTEAAGDYAIGIAAGSSMAPRINHGDRFLVRLQPDPPLNSLCVAARPDHCMYVKVLRPGTYPKPYELHSLNEQFEPIRDVKDWVFKGAVVAIVLRSAEPGRPNIEFDMGRPLRG